MATAVAIPFNAAAHHHVEGPFADVSFTPGAATANLLTGSAGEVPAYPFLRAIWLLVTTSGGVVGTSAALNADAPWNVFESLQLADANGAAIYGGIGVWGGFDAYLAHKYGGYAWASDPAGNPDYDDAPAAFTFALRIPVEFDDRSGAGSLGNMASNAPFRLTLVGNTSAAIYSDAPATIPAVRVRAYIETWTLPKSQTLQGQPQEQVPPGGIGTTQYWRKSSFSVTASSQNTVRFTDVGNLIREWILIGRDADGARVATLTWSPDPFTLGWDGVPLLVEPPRHRRALMAESLGFGLYNTALAAQVGSIDAGVLVFPFCAPNGHIDGGDGPNAWLPTLQSTRIEFSGAFGASIASLDVLTNSIAAVESAQPFGFGAETGQLLGPAQPSTR